MEHYPVIVSERKHRCWDLVETEEVKYYATFKVST